MPLRYASFVYFFVLLVQMAFSFRPRLLLRSTVCGAVAWTLGFLWIATRPGVITQSVGGTDRPTMLRLYFDPNYASSLKYQNEVLAFLVVGASLALLVRRSRALVTERAAAERARGNLSRYFSPKVVDALAERDEPLGRVRRQVVGVLFADLVGFTTLAEAMTPEDLMAMLRDFHGHMEEEVFRHGGCLEKFIGDALLAFRRPRHGRPGRHRRAGLRARDAGRAAGVERRACGRGGASPPDGGGPALRPGRGRRHRESAQHGLRDHRRHHNIASRLQALTRDLGTDLVASSALVAAVEREGANAGLLRGLSSRGAHVLRGRDTPIEIWAS
jgi:adenylate cyclase